MRTGAAWCSLLAGMGLRGCNFACFGGTWGNDAMQEVCTYLDLTHTLWALGRAKKRFTILRSEDPAVSGSAVAGDRERVAADTVLRKVLMCTSTFESSRINTTATGR